jgi:outer membrane immunogenic protein
MKRLILLATALVSSLSAASAADLPLRGALPPVPAPAPTYFQGLYVGAQLGGLGFADRTQSIFAPTNATLTSSVGHGGSFLGGARAGYDWRYGPIVCGVMADLSGARAVTNTTVPVFGYAVRNTLDVNGSLRGRVGVTLFDRGLVYVSGGLALAHLEHAYATPFGAAKTNEVFATPTVGVGVEYAIDSHWRAHIDYRLSGARGQVEAQNFARPALATRHEFGQGALTAGVSYGFDKQ